MGILLKKLSLLTFNMKITLVLAILFSIGTMTSACCKGYNCCKRNCSQSSRLGRSLSVDEEIESLAFIICNTDSNPGLSWAEIEECELSYCGILPINCPSQEDFEYFDDDKNGILTWSEWKLKSGSYGHEP